MSRPFSYNDENFTVIGNVLFIHIYVSNVKANERIMEIPYEIGKRCIQRSAQGFLQAAGLYKSYGYLFSGIITYENGKYYLSTSSDIKAVYYATAFLFLKDI